MFLPSASWMFMLILCLNLINESSLSIFKNYCNYLISYLLNWRIRADYFCLFLWFMLAPFAKNKFAFSCSSFWKNLRNAVFKLPSVSSIYNPISIKFLRKFSLHYLSSLIGTYWEICKNNGVFPLISFEFISSPQEIISRSKFSSKQIAG